jgi:hypothetical protein
MDVSVLDKHNTKGHARVRREVCKTTAEYICSIARRVKSNGTYSLLPGADSAERQRRKIL